MRLMKNYKDPHKEREAKKYDRPIPSRELMLEVMDKTGHPVGFNELADALGVTETTRSRCYEIPLTRHGA